MKKCNFHVKPIGLLDMLHFKQMVPRRRAMLQAGSLDPITSVYAVNRLAQSLHPKRQKAVVSAIIPRKDANTYVLKADKLAYFRAGQYVSVKLRIGTPSRPGPTRWRPRPRAPWRGSMRSRSSGRRTALSPNTSWTTGKSGPRSRSPARRGPSATSPSATRRRSSVSPAAAASRPSWRWHGRSSTGRRTSA